jgi:uncharacterized protein (DUF427 family)
MEQKIVKQPSSDHPIEIGAAVGKVTILLSGVAIAETNSALVLREASYPPVYYIPRQDIRPEALLPSSHTSYCPYKGDCSYHDVTAGEKVINNAGWFYDRPYPAVAAIKDHIAFYPDRVEVRVVGD